MSLPSAVKTVVRLKRMIRLNERPADFIHQFLASGSREANIVGNTLLENREALKLISSPAGRKWLWTWFNDTLDYLQRIAEKGGK